MNTPLAQPVRPSMRGLGLPRFALGLGLVLGTACTAAIALRGGALVGVLDGHDVGTRLLAVAVAAWLVWQRRAEVTLDARGGILGPVLLLSAAFLSVLGERLSMEFVARAAVVLAVPGLLGLVLPDRSVRALLPAAAVLLFALPLPGLLVDEIGMPLQRFDARAVELLALALGAQVERTGTFVTIDGTTVGIDAGCSGLTLVWPLLIATWAALFARPLGNRLRLALCLAVVPVALLANLLRLLVTVALFGALPVGDADRLHDLLGLVTVCLAGVVPFLLVPDREGGAPRAAPSSRDGAGSVVLRGSLVLAAFGVASLGSSSVSMAASMRGLAVTDPAALHARLDALPYRVGEWIGRARELPAREAEILAADAVLHRVYVPLHDEDELLVVAAAHHDADQAWAHLAPRCYGVRGWGLTHSTALGASGHRYGFQRRGRHITVFEYVLPLQQASDDGALRIQIVLDGDRSDAGSAALAQGFMHLLVAPVVQPEHA